MFFDMFNILNGPTDKTEGQMIGRPPERRQYPFVGGPLLPTNLYDALDDLTICRCPMESAL